MSNNSEHVRFSGRRGSRKGRQAFTLVELLVVVAIIALLVSILLPTLGRAKAAAKLVMCSTNMHAIGRGAFLYGNEWDGYLPRDAAWAPYQAGDLYQYYLFAARFSHYVGGPEITLAETDTDTKDQYMYDIFKNVHAFKCPSFQDDWYGSEPYVLTYLCNGWNFDHPVQTDRQHCPIAESRLINAPCAPAEVVYISELNGHRLAASPDDKKASRFGQGEPKLVVFGKYDYLDFFRPAGGYGYGGADLTFDDNGNENVDSEGRGTGRMIGAFDERHNGRTTMAFFDGHGESRRLHRDDMPIELFYPRLAN